MPDRWSDFKSRLHVWSYDSRVLGLPWRIWDELRLQRHQARVKRRDKAWAAQNARRQWQITPVPDHSPYQYVERWSCADCGCESAVCWDKCAAAIETMRKARATWCSGCGGAERASSSLSMPTPDADVLAVWMADPEHCFMSQDEDLILDDVSLDALLTCLAQCGDTGKSWALAETVAVKLLDDRFTDEAARERAVAWLSANRDLWDTPACRDHVRERVMRLLADHATSKGDSSP